MTNEYPDAKTEEFEESHFLQLVYSLQGSAWLLLGKIINPMTGRAEKDLESAKAVIDTLSMLKKKTAGNLTQSEKKLLDNAVSMLELNYAEEAEKEKNELSEKEMNPKVKTDKPEHKSTDDEKP